MAGRNCLSNSIRVWRPETAGHGKAGLAVPYRGKQKMTRELYKSLLLERLQELIEADPKAAYQELTASSEYSPDLYTIALYHPQKDWAVQILMCDQMMMCLNQINWDDPGEYLHLSPSEIPGLAMLLEAF